MVVCHSSVDALILSHFVESLKAKWTMWEFSLLKYTQLEGRTNQGGWPTPPKTKDEILGRWALHLWSKLCELGMLMLMMVVGTLRNEALVRAVVAAGTFS
jgi:hypothetical protein